MLGHLPCFILCHMWVSKSIFFSNRLYYQQFEHLLFPRLLASSKVTWVAFLGFILPQWSILWYFCPVADSHTISVTGTDSFTASCCVGTGCEDCSNTGCCTLAAVSAALRVTVAACGVIKYWPSTVTTVPLVRHWLRSAVSVVTKGYKRLQSGSCRRCCRVRLIRRDWHRHRLHQRDTRD